jgi:hypothetical protein
VIDYSKPGKTPPGTKHPRPAKRDRLTWIHLVRPAQPAESDNDGVVRRLGKRLRGEQDEPETVTITTFEPPVDRRPRRERRADPNWEPPTLVVHKDVPIEEVAHAREGRRATKAYIARRQRRGQRNLVRTQLRKEFHDDTIRAQMDVLETRSPGDPMYDNVYNGLVAKHGLELEKLAAADA